MVSPMVPFAFALHSNRGAYAVLLGSGVSSAAGIPTGWEVVQDLTAKIARLEGVDPGPDPAAWYREHFGREPEYSVVLVELARSPAERSNLLRGYFEPTQADRERGVRVPGPAHVALAKLAASGHLRLFLTTNFDRLLEQALEDAGVIPTVLSTPDSLEGAGPLAHLGCTVLKLNGDDRDSRIKNTAAELDSYDEAVDALLDRVLEENGLIISGWSADWDTALHRAIGRSRSDRYTMYWTCIEEPGSHAAELIEARQAEVLRVASADAFFTELQTKAAALDDGGDAAATVDRARAPATGAGAPEETAPATPAESPAIEAPHVRYARSRDGVNIAYTAAGDGSPIVQMDVTTSTLELAAHVPEFDTWRQRMAARRMLVQYDGRGAGLSQRNVDDHSLEAQLSDVDAVVHALGLDRFALLGVYITGPLAIEYAARHPERVSHLTLWSTFARYADFASSSVAQAIQSLFAQSWRLYTNAFAGWAGASDPDSTSKIGKVMEEASTPERQAAYASVLREFDLTDTLTGLKMPTLVLHPLHHPIVNADLARDLAAQIPNASLVMLDGNGLWPATNDIDTIVRAINDFLGTTDGAAR